MNKGVNKSKIFMIISICILCISIIGGSLAYYRKLIFNTSASTITHGLEHYIRYTKGQNINAGTLVPTYSYDESNESNASISFYKIDNTYDIYGHIFLDINDIGDKLANSPALKYTLVSNDVVLAEGTFMGSKKNDSILVKADIPLSTSEQIFTIYVWLDKNEKIAVDIEGQAFSVTIRCEATMKNKYEGKFLRPLV